VYDNWYRRRTELSHIGHKWSLYSIEMSGLVGEINPSLDNEFV